MSRHGAGQGPTGSEPRSMAELRLVIEACDRYEAAWRAGTPLHIEDLLAEASAHERPALLRELVALELELRRQRGEVPTLGAYTQRFPDGTDWIESLFETERTATVARGSSATEAWLTPRDSARRPATPEPTTQADPHTDSTPTHPEIPGFAIMNELGRGGMGIVYRARELSLNRDVALKILPPAFAADPIRLRRFRTEATIAAGLSNARILPVFHVLELAGTPVIVMPFVEGTDLGRLIGDRKAVLKGESDTGRHPTSGLDQKRYLESVLPLLDQVVEAVAAIHEAGVLHRDIKPSNVLVDRNDNVLLTDFGLARLGPDAGITVAGAGLGTPGYMSPEQWEGQEDIDRRADVFGLGATLYHTLTLELPYGKQPLTTQSRPPARPSARQTALPADYDWVLLKALELDRRNRYGSAVEFRDDWRRVRAGLLPDARRAGRAHRVVRWVRQRGWSAAAVLILILSLGMLAGLRDWVNPAPLGPDAPRPVALITSPPGARAVLVPLDPASGELLPPKAVHAAGGASSPARLSLAPGDYFVEVQWPDRAFHQVYRHVPRSNEAPGVFRHHGWTVRNDGVIELRQIEKPAAAVLVGMTHFPGAARFHMGFEHVAGAPPAGRRLEPFYLDPHEVCVGELPSFSLPVPLAQQQLSPGPDEAVRFISHDEALHYIELMGKRLPTEAEVEFAATAGGTQPFPSPDADRYVRRAAWPFGPVATPEFDRTHTQPPVFGLFSNVAEWTSSWFFERPSAGQVSWPGGPPDLRVVRGGPQSVIEGKPDPREFHLDAHVRSGQSPHSVWLPGVGFRGARSAAPLFLKPNGR